MGNSKSKGRSNPIGRDSDKTESSSRAASAHPSSNPGSSSRSKHQRGNSYPISRATPDPKLADMEDRIDDQELHILKCDMRDEPERFILNNLMMCVEFFANFDEEIAEIRESLVSPRENGLNSRLPAQKRAVLPDVLQEHISKKIAFTTNRQTTIVEPLQPIRVFVVHDNIEVTEKMCPTHYSSVNDTITYYMQLKHIEKPGISHLELKDEVPPKKTSKPVEDEGEISSIAENDDDYSDGDSIYVSKEKLQSSLKPASIKEQRQADLSSFSHSLPDLYNDGRGHAFGKRLGPDDYYSQRSDQDLKSESDSERSPPGGLKTNKCRTQSRSNPKLPGSRISPASSTSSGYRSGTYAMDSDSSDYSYTPKNIRTKSKQLAYMKISPELPANCFKKVTYTSGGKIYRRERRQKLDSKQLLIRDALDRYNYQVSYTSSVKFMKHFCYVFVNQLASAFGFDNSEVDNSRAEGSVIYCDKITVLPKRTDCTLVEPYEITPCLWSQWPSCAEEFVLRPRNNWPSYEVVEKIREFGCYIVPENFDLHKKGRSGGSSNVYQGLQWQLTFPAAERYLETCMTYTQVRVYLIALLLHKTFIRSSCNTAFGITTAHIRNCLFWMIEENDSPSNWMEHETGDILKALLNTLHRFISRSELHLPDYFISDRNLFDNAYNTHLWFHQKQLQRIIENPIMFVFQAMRNIQYGPKFFPKFNFEMFYKIVTLDTDVLLDPSSAIYSGSISSAASQHKGYKKHEKESQFSYKVVANKTMVNNTKKANDSIVEMRMRCRELDEVRSCKLLDFFIKHFLQMAETCHEYGAEKQKFVYLNQSRRLTMLLSEHEIYREESKAFLLRIGRLRRVVTKLKTKEAQEPPQTPKRNSDHPYFSSPLKDRFSMLQVSQEVEPNTGAGTSDLNEVGNTDKKDAVIYEENNAASIYQSKRAKKVTMSVIAEVESEDVEPSVERKEKAPVVAIAESTQESTYI